MKRLSTSRDMKFEHELVRKRSTWWPGPDAECKSPGCSNGAYSEGKSMFPDRWPNNGFCPDCDPDFQNKDADEKPNEKDASTGWAMAANTFGWKRAAHEWKKDHPNQNWADLTPEELHRVWTVYLHDHEESPEQKSDRLRRGEPSPRGRLFDALDTTKLDQNGGLMNANWGAQIGAFVDDPSYDLNRGPWPNYYDDNTDRRSKRQSDFDLRPGVRWNAPTQDPNFVPDQGPFRIEDYNEVEDYLQELVYLKEQLEDYRGQIPADTQSVDPQMERLYQQVAAAQANLQRALERRQRGEKPF